MEFFPKEAKSLFDRLFKWLNDLNPRQLLILAGVVMVLMFGGIYVFLNWWTDRGAEEVKLEPPPPPIQTRTVVMAKVDIPPLAIIKSEMLETKEVAEDLVPEGAVTDVAEVLNTPAKSEIFAGDVLTDRKLLSDLRQLTFVSSIPNDCRAVSISVNEITSVDGFAKPGDRVDLLLAEKGENSGATTSILLQDVLLLSINKNMSKGNKVGEGEDGKAVTQAVENPSTATFALRPDEVLKLVSASKLGEIYLALRPSHPTNEYNGDEGYTIRPADSQKPQQSTPANVSELPPIPPMTPEQSETTPDVNRIEIIQGDKIVQKN